MLAQSKTTGSEQVNAPADTGGAVFPEPEKTVKKTVPKPITVAITISDARQLYELYQNLEAADAHYQTCQSRGFRDHMQKVYRAANVQSAFAELKSQLDNMTK